MWQLTKDKIIFKIFGICVLSTSLFGEQMSNSEIAIASQNPITLIYSLPIQNNTYFGLGDTDEVKNIANFQPVIPMDITKDWDIVWRMIMPVVTTPGTPTSFNHDGEVTSFTNSTTALGDTTLSAFLAPKESGKFIWGAGAIAYIPTATDDALETKQWGLGPSFIGLRIDGNWTYGALIMNVWSFGVNDSVGGKKIDFMQLQPFVNYNMGDGWFLTTVPFITAKWEEDSEDIWTVPLGGGFGKGFKIGRVPVSATAQAYYSVIKPETMGEDWQLRLQAQIFFPRND
jgi:hypothetical protein